MSSDVRAARQWLAAFGTAALFGLVAPGCYGTETTVFPEGFEPWETQMSAPAAGTEADPCPETLVLVESPSYDPPDGQPIASSVHGTACIHAPMRTVWEGIQDPQTGRDPTVASWTLVDELDDECDATGTEDGRYESEIVAGPETFRITFRLCWRFALVEGTAAAPTRVVSRWQKIVGTTAIRVLEGTVTARPFDGDPEGTSIVDYQYHLNSASIGPSNVETINTYLTEIYGRLRRRSHGESIED